MLSQTTIENRIRAWLSLIFPTTEIIINDATIPSGSRPGLPYISINFLGLQIISDNNYQSQPDISEKSKITGIREITFSINYFGVDSQTELEKITVFAKDDNLISFLLIDGISYIDNTGIRDLTFLRDTVYEPRAGIDLIFRIASQEIIDAFIIETVGINGEIRDQANNILKEIEISNI